MPKSLFRPLTIAAVFFAASFGSSMPVWAAPLSPEGSASASSAAPSLSPLALASALTPSPSSPGAVPEPSASAAATASAAPNQDVVPSQRAIDPTQFTAEEVGVDEKLGQIALLDVELRDEDGAMVPLRRLVDRPTILTLNYFRCAGICSPQLNGLAAAIRHTNAVPGKDFRVITVSFDERDTAEMAARKRANYLRETKRPITPEDWRFLTGDAATTRKVADSVGFHFKQVDADFVHPGALMLLSPQGKITRYMYGTTYLPADLDMAVLEAARGEVQPTINKWLKFCYSYDPAGRQYTLSVTRIAGMLILGAVMVFAFVLAMRGKRTKTATTTRGA